MPSSATDLLTPANLHASRATAILEGCSIYVNLLSSSFFIDFSSEKFIGYDALSKSLNTKPHKKLVGVELDWQNISNFEPKEFKRVRWYPVSAHQKNQEIGYITSIVWSPTVKKVIGFGHLDGEALDATQKIDLIWENNEQISASLCPLPFYKRNRKD